MHKETEQRMPYRMFGVAFLLFVLWLLLSWAGVTRTAEIAIANSLPRSLVIVNLILAPSLALIAGGPLRISAPVRLVMLALALCSLVILKMAFNIYPLASCILLVSVLLEAYWIIPKWTAQQRGTAATTVAPQPKQ